jgi:hypothetical protein
MMDVVKYKMRTGVRWNESDVAWDFKSMEKLHLGIKSSKDLVSTKIERYE